MSEAQIIERKNVTFSQYEKTGNKAIDLVAECVSYYRGIRMPIKAVRLRENYYWLFVKGTEVLMKAAGKEFDDRAILDFDQVEVKDGGGAQFESIEVEFYPLTLEKADA